MGHSVSKEARRKISVANIDRIHSEETKQKMRLSHKDKHKGSSNNILVTILFSYTL